MPREPLFVASGMGYRVKTLLYDAWSFFTFLIFLVLVFTVGAPLRLLDRLFGIRLLDRLIWLFECVAR